MEDIGSNEVESVSVEDIGPAEEELTRPKVAEKYVIIVRLGPDYEEIEDVEDGSQPEEPKSQEKDLLERVLVYSIVKLLKFLVLITKRLVGWHL